MITVHCGLHKTGSSSIQFALSNIPKTVRRRVVTPNAGDDRSDEGWAQRLAVLTVTPDAVFSNENLLGEPYDGYRRAPERVAILRSSLAGARFQIVVYLRPQVDWLASVYLQGVQEGRTTSPDDFWAAMAPERYLSWSALVDLLREHSGADRVIVRAHEQSRDAVADFLRLCALEMPPRTARQTIRENVSISALQAPILTALNRGDGLTRERRLRLRQAFQGVLIDRNAVPLSPFPEAMQREMAEHYRADWLAVTQSVESSDPVEAVLFRNLGLDWDNFPKPFPGASVTDAAISVELLRCLAVLVESLGEPRSRGPWARAWTKLREDPLDLHRAVARHLGR